MCRLASYHCLDQLFTLVIFYKGASLNHRSKKLRPVINEPSTIYLCNDTVTKKQTNKSQCWKEITFHKFDSIDW